MVYPGQHPLLPSPPSAGVLPDYRPIFGGTDVSIAAVSVMSVTDASGWASLTSQARLSP